MLFEIGKKIFVSLIILMSITLPAIAQITILKPYDIAKGIKDTTVQIVTNPALNIGSIEKMFDGNPYTEAGVRNSDTLVAMLSFKEPVTISRCRVFFFNNGQWWLESANSQEDLEQKTGSYRQIVTQQSFKVFVWDSLDFSALAIKFIRLKARNTEFNSMIMGEWELYTGVTLTALAIWPNPIRVLPGTKFKPKVKILDDQGNMHPYDLTSPIIWSVDNVAIATIDNELGVVTGVSLGTTKITAAAKGLTGLATVSVETDFASINASTLNVKVALVVQDPIIDFANQRKIHQVRGWDNPYSIVTQIIKDLTKASDGVVNFQIVETHDDTANFSRMDGRFMTLDTIAYFFSSPARLYGRDVPGTLQNISEVQGRVRFDYNAMIDYYDFDTKRNNGVIDEVWVYTFPFAAMYESQLVGPGAFWYNSPPLDHPGLQKLLSVMGWNYERDVGCAEESFGHRCESAIYHVFGRWKGDAVDPNYWEIFTTIDKDKPGKAHVGNIHYPPNGLHDYDFGNRRYVTTFADNWKRFPILLDQTRKVNCDEWKAVTLPEDIKVESVYQWGYFKWWYSHLPRFTGVTDGILNNWWHYIVDYEGAVALANQQTTSIQNREQAPNLQPGAYLLEQNFPNPFNQLTQIRFYLPIRQHVILKIYDLLGREIKTMIDEWKDAGPYQLNFDGKGLTSGIYFYKLQAGDFSETKKFLMLK